MNLQTELYHSQTQRWPQHGQHILAHFDARSVVVYQAYRAAIGRYAAQHQTFGGEFSFTRMTWIKTNFLWMMYRSGWGTKPDQEVTLAIRMQRAGFDQLLREAVHSSFDPAIYADLEAWKAAVAESSVRIQWDPDHDPHGAKLERRAVQLGLRDAALMQYVHTWIIEIEDISDFVAEQRSVLEAHPDCSRLRTPTEAVYPIQA